MKPLSFAQDVKHPPIFQTTARYEHDEIGRDTAEVEDVIFIIEPRLLIRECLARALHHMSRNGTVRAFSSVAEWQTFDKRNLPKAVVLFSLGNHIRSRTEIDSELALLAHSESTLQVVLVSENEDAIHILEALDSGARGFIPMTVPLEVAFEAIRLVRAGGVFVPASSLIASRRSIEEASTPPLRYNGMFTERQTAVVEALRQGKANKIIAYELNMRESTVKVHIRNVMRKLKAKNRTEVAYLTQELFGGQREVGLETSAG